MGGTEVCRWLTANGLSELQAPLSQAGYDDLVDLKELTQDTRLFASIIRSPGLRMKVKRLMSGTEDTFKNNPMSEWAKASCDPLKNAPLDTWAKCAAEQPAPLAEWASAAVSPCRPTSSSLTKGGHKHSSAREVVVVSPDSELPIKSPLRRPSKSPIRPVRSTSQISNGMEQTATTSHSMSEILFKHRSAAAPPKPAFIPDPRVGSGSSTPASAPIVGRVSPTPKGFPFRPSHGLTSRADPTFGSPYRRNSSLRAYDPPPSPVSNHHRSLMTSIYRSSSSDIPSPRNTPVGVSHSFYDHQRPEKKKISASESIRTLQLDPNFQAALAKITTPAAEKVNSTTVTRQRAAPSRAGVSTPSTSSPRFRDPVGMFMPMSPKSATVRTPAGLGSTSSRVRRMSPAPPSAPSGDLFNSSTGGGTPTSTPTPAPVTSRVLSSPIPRSSTPLSISNGFGNVMSTRVLDSPNAATDTELITTNESKHISPPRGPSSSDLPEGFRVMLDVVGVLRQAFCWCSPDGSLMNIIVDGDTSLKVNFADIRQATASLNKRIELHTTDNTDSVIFETDDTTVYRTLIAIFKQTLPDGKLAIIPL